ncbi:MAG: DNA repair protein RecN [Chloroflexi bacterium]|jgi:DNA repair protein RecN (Recombination protein N)|nr:DNA repair protein RecN [Chloroflexota bacterium]
MLRELHIQNFAIITDLTLHFDNGLVIFTGETGAGKSIILDALSAVLGQRVDSTVVRQGSRHAYVEAHFDLDERMLEILKPMLEGENLFEEGFQLVLSREIRAEGRTIARVNGRSVNLGIQADIGAVLVDVHGQSEHLSLLKVKSHRELLDRFAQNNLILEDYQADYRQWMNLQGELKKLNDLQAHADERADILRYQIGQIEAAKLAEGEEEALRQESTRLANAEVLSLHAQAALQALDESDPESRSVTDLLGSAANDLIALSRIDQKLQPLSEQVEAALSNLTDIAYELRRYNDQIEYNPARLDQIEVRIDLINSLKRKHGGSVTKVLEFYSSAQNELEQIEGVESEIKQTKAKIDQLKTSLAKKALRIRETRKHAAQELTRQMQEQLSELEMRKARLRVNVSDKHDPEGLDIDGTLAFDAYGIDQVEFLIETNPGEGFKPLAKIASGGETSRLMLALKNVLAEADQIPTLVFDEIDSGIGGRVGMTVGELLWKLARHHQVMCVTHLPQLAAFGDQHIRVNKQVSDTRTITQVQELTGQARVAELAEMLGSTSPKGIQTAQEILTSVAEITGTI